MNNKFILKNELIKLILFFLFVQFFFNRWDISGQWINQKENLRVLYKININKGDSVNIIMGDKEKEYLIIKNDQTNDIIKIYPFILYNLDEIEEIESKAKLFVRKDSYLIKYKKYDGHLDETYKKIKNSLKINILNY
nr:hypothetical protein [uncultured Cetobacterium sp.]